MIFRIGEALEDGISDTFSKLGARIVGLAFAASLVYQSGLESIIFPADSAPVTTVALTSDTFTAGLMTIAGFLATILVFYIAIRHFYEDRGTLDLGMLSGSFFPLLNIFVGSLVFGLAVIVGTLLFLVPGVYLYVSLVFFSIIIAAKNVNFIEAFRRSWDITGGSRFRILLLFLFLIALSLPVSAVTLISTTVLELTSASRVLGFSAGVFIQLLTSLMTVFYFATLVSVYRQLEGTE
jgi:hypothetical protein